MHLLPLLIALLLVPVSSAWAQPSQREVKVQRPFVPQRLQTGPVPSHEQPMLEEVSPLPGRTPLEVNYEAQKERVRLMKRQFDLRIQIGQVAVSRFSHEQAIKMEEIQRAEKEVIRSAHRLTELEQMQKKLKADILKMAKPVDGPDDDPNRLPPQEADEARKQLQFVEDELTQHRSRAEFIQREFNNRNSEMQALQSRQLEQRLKHELMIIEGHLEMLEGRKQLRLLELELKRQQPVEPEQPDDIDQVPAETP